ncbi:two-component response regulator ARR11 isoform X2 [Rhodamnia argentea]|uniref:Two-component response regulator n=1 Tax=Rhodamnia argentea TaxID=178133 RepID=A0A8B8NYN9_9MYRT|nr:two-component response regulator ARR11 isoform X2 [Rhodamnia argentea]
MMESSKGFSSPRSTAFPAGLRVLVVDDDPTWLKILEKMLKKCSYEVTTCGLARDALKLLRERKGGYDIVISDVNMPDMDGFKLLELVGLEMDLPVIMMSVDGETSRVKKGVQHGACDYLLKPIRMKELRNIWQHVFRKRIHEVRDIESHEGLEGLQVTQSGFDQFDDGHFFSGEDMLTPAKKRKDLENKHDEKDFTDSSSSTKKARVVWSVDLHQKFVKAVNLIGYDRKDVTCLVCSAEVGPKKILDLMNIPWLTRENVASHLQKYRLYLSRLQKENDLKISYGGMKHSDLNPQDAARALSRQNSINFEQNDATNCNSRISGNNLLIQNLNSKSNEINPRGTTITEKSSPGISHSLSPLEQEMKFPAIDGITPGSYSWREVPEIQFHQENAGNQPEDCFRRVAVPMGGLQNHVQIDQLLPVTSISSKAQLPNLIETKPLNVDYAISSFTQASPVKTRIDSFPVPTKIHTGNQQAIQPPSTNKPSMESQAFNPSCVTNLESSQRNFSSTTPESAFTSPDEVLQVGWLQDYSTCLGLQNIEFPDFGDPSMVAEVPMHLYTALKFDFEQLSDQSELPVINQGLFIA